MPIVIATNQEKQKKERRRNGIASEVLLRALQDLRTLGAMTQKMYPKKPL